MSRLIDMALRSWPDEYRAEHGEELVATAAELGEGRSTLREATSLFLAGWRARFRAATKGSQLATWTAAVRIALFVSIVAVVAEVLIAWQRGPGPNLAAHELDQAVIAGLIGAGGTGLLMLLAPIRIVAMLGTVAGAISVFWGPQMPRGALTIYLITHVGALWFLAWRDRPAERRMAWPFVLLLGTVAALAYATGNFWFSLDALLLWTAAIGLAISAWDPRLLAGMCLYWLMRLAIWIPGLIADRIWERGFVGFYLLSGAVVAVGIAQVRRSVARSRLA